MSLEAVVIAIAILVVLGLVGVLIADYFIDHR